jgi:hypothetical protein
MKEINEKNRMFKLWLAELAIALKVLLFVAFFFTLGNGIAWLDNRFGPAYSFGALIVIAICGICYLAYLWAREEYRRKTRA